MDSSLSSNSLLGIGWVSVAVAMAGGVAVLIGLAAEKFAEWLDNKYCAPPFKPHARLEFAGWCILMFGICVEIADAVVTVREIRKAQITAIRNDPLNQPISDMSAKVVFFVKKEHFGEVTNWFNGLEQSVGAMYLMINKDDMGFILDPLKADKFSRKQGAIFGEPNARDNVGYSLRFQSENWLAFMGQENRVSTTTNVHWIRMDLNFLTNGVQVSDGGIELIVNNSHKLFRILPQSDVRPGAGTPFAPYTIWATNVGNGFQQ